MLESSIFILSLITAFISILVALILVLAKVDNYDGIYCYFEDSEWKQIPKILAQKYLAFLKRLFGDDLLGVRASVNIIAFSFMLTVLIMILWRGFSINSIEAAIEQALSGMFGVTVLTWGISSALVAPLSLMITSKLLLKSSNSQDHKKVYQNTVLDLLATYLLISLSLYICLLTTMSSIALVEQGWGEAFEIAKLFGTFAHGNALTWPTHSVTSVAGLSARIVAIATLIPTITFIFLMFLSFLAAVIFKLITPIVVSKLDWLSKQDSAKLSVVIALLCALITMFANLIKPLELMNT
ncbi:hypothetical protein BM523_02405 [Alteromonas mediterranea]|uniref:hypothetical protein n=1 Tax=Alteromonas mediterranea TaxID=314275 RepID=UPI000903CB83|nr:hypothetical protein [Alteromonas mediterranea]APD92947.1 hypothetical protein BM523_02405 [Alteromonas mediterranea]APD96561.1 hypothetical protein BM525_02390 [Alteromonas mediterranea]